MKYDHMPEFENSIAHYSLKQSKCITNIESVDGRRAVEAAHVREDNAAECKDVDNDNIFHKWTNSFPKEAKKYRCSQKRNRNGALSPVILCKVSYCVHDKYDCQSHKQELRESQWMENRRKMQREYNIAKFTPK